MIQEVPVFQSVAMDSANPKVKFAPPSQPKALLPHLKNDITALDIRFDIRELRSLVEATFNEWQQRHKPGSKSYSGIGLQSADGFDDLYDTMSNFEDLNKVRPVTPEEFIHLNEIGKKFQHIFDRFRDYGINLHRARLVVAYPGHSHDLHFDYDYRIHIPIITNAGCNAVYGRAKYHMEADGYAFLHNGYHQHTLENLGTSNRVHFIAGINGLVDLHLNPRSRPAEDTRRSPARTESGAPAKLSSSLQGDSRK